MNLSQMTKEITPPQPPNEADALSALADLVFQPLGERAPKLERKEQLRQAMKEYLETPSAANSTPGRSRA